MRITVKNEHSQGMSTGDRRTLTLRSTVTLTLSVDNQNPLLCQLRERRLSLHSQLCIVSWEPNPKVYSQLYIMRKTLLSKSHERLALGDFFRLMTQITQEPKTVSAFVTSRERTWRFFSPDSATHPACGYSWPSGVVPSRTGPVGSLTDTQDEVCGRPGAMLLWRPPWLLLLLLPCTATVAHHHRRASWSTRGMANKEPSGTIYHCLATVTACLPGTLDKERHVWVDEAIDVLVWVRVDQIYINT